MRQLAFLYGFILPFTSVFALSGWLNLPVLISLLLVFALMFKGVHRLKPFDIVVFVSFVFPIFISSIINFHNALEEKFISHLLSYFFIFFTFYLVSREMLLRHPAALLKGVMGGLVFSIIFAFVEFAITLTLGYELLSYIPRFTVNEYNATFSSVLRVRSLTEESGHYALYLGIITPIVLIFMVERFSSIFIIILIAAAFLAMIVTFSTSGIMFFIISAIFSFLAARYSIFKKSFLVGGLVLFFVSVYFGVLTVFNIDLTNLLFDKIHDMNGRLGPFDESWRYFINSGILQILFGLGPGYYAYFGLEPVISLAALTLFQNGLIGFLLYIALFFFGFKRVAVFSKDKKPFLVFSLLFTFLVYGGVSNYWYPWFWLLLGVLSVGPSAVIFSSAQPVPEPKS